MSFQYLQICDVFKIQPRQLTKWLLETGTRDHVTRDTCAGRVHDEDDKEIISKKSLGLTGPLIINNLCTSNL